MEVVAAAMARIERLSPIGADRLRWRRRRRHDFALRVVDAFVSRGDVVVDAGASRGLYTARMRDLVGRRGAVHAFEPNQLHHERLRRLAAHGIVTLHPAALSDHLGGAELRTPVIGGHEYGGWATLEARPDATVRTVSVPTVRLDDVLSGERVAFIKCDVEGHEAAVLRGAQQVLERSRPRILIEIEQRHRVEDVSTTFAVFAALGYQGWMLAPGGLRPLAKFDLERDQLAFLANGPPSSEAMPLGYVHNFLFLPNAEDVARLLDRTHASTHPRARAGR
jgi:FkbM family methyltransferase